jgi:hypothetical protein
MAKTAWSISGEEIASCNCAWGCPCQFNALPTSGRCEAFVAMRVDEGHFGDTSLGGVVYATVLWFPGAVHEGNGKVLHVIDEKATAAQRSAIEALLSGQRGGRRIRDLRRGRAQPAWRRLGPDHVRVRPRSAHR